ncbi:hypothetical protein ACFL1G_11520, partial [Planctomycetota bacterium]
TGLKRESESKGPRCFRKIKWDNPKISGSAAEAEISLPGTPWAQEALRANEGRVYWYHGGMGEEQTKEE